MQTESTAPSFSTNFRFTKSSLQAAVAWFRTHGDKKKDQLDCYDTDCVGLIAVLYRSGRINFRSRPVLHKRRISVALGDNSAHNTVEQARLKCMAVRLQPAQGIDPRAANRVGITFGELCTDHYFPAVRNRKRSIKDDIQKFDRWLSQRFGHLPLAAIKSADIIAFLDLLRDHEGLTAATANRYLALIKAVWRYAVENDLHPKSPAQYIQARSKFSAIPMLVEVGLFLRDTPDLDLPCEKVF